GADHVAKVEQLIKNYQVGGLCFFQGSPEKQAELNNRYQRLSKKVPMMISMDAEWGLGMRLKENAISFPYQLMLGAIQDNPLLYDMGKEVARQCRRLGVHINFAPVADVNNNPENPVINFRSFGEDRYNVAVKSYMYMKGMQDGKVMACAKHFPGHGDTDVDSHYDLPVISHANQRLDSIELFPFRVLAQHGIESMMIAHLHVPAIDATPNLPTTLSKNAVSDLLQEKIGFDGLIFTDGLGMKGVTKHYRPGEVEAKAMVAGNDVLLLPEDVPAAFKEIKNYLDKGLLDRNQFHESVKKILRSKYDLGLTSNQAVDLTNLRSDLNNTKALSLKRKLIQNALTLVRNEEQLLPFKVKSQQRMAVLSIGSVARTPFQKTIQLYDTAIAAFNVGKDITSSQHKRLFQQLKDKEVVMIGLHDMSNRASKGFGISITARRLIDDLRKSTKVVLSVFGNPYSLKYFDEIDWVLEAYNEEEVTQNLAAQALFGAFSIRGRLPVTASTKSKFNQGIITSPLFRLGYEIPERVGLRSEVLNQIDDIAQEAIQLKATPGCAVLVAKNGKIVFHKAYGYHTYAKKKRLERHHLFDLASITKVAATTISVMKLAEEGKINIHQNISQYLPELKGTNKANMTIEEIMTHRAGLKAWIPFFEQTLSGSKRNPRPSSKYYYKKQTDKFNIPVTDNLFMRTDFAEEIKKQIRESELRANKNYKYSDIGFYLLADLVERISGQRIDQYVQHHFYQPLGLRSTTYNPWRKFGKSSIVPSEKDKYFRRQVVQGYVHDMGAAMLGGVSGHAGLFANANELAVLMQMLLNGGYYGGRQFLKSETVRTFTTKRASCTRRGIGFDLRETDLTRSQNMSDKASPKTFGHLGFTGTCTWVDPEQDLIYIFLSNRTYPSMRNYKLNKEDIRPRIQSVIYEALEPPAS
ncbi:MAG: glycoside hydrolase family 3 N-terminal domain-containing protein, partial [Bacteroidota bacterium]